MGEFFKLRGIFDTEWVFIDGSDIRAHQHASRARCGEVRAIGTSRSEATTKIHLAVDAHGHPIDFEITGSEVHDSQVASQLIELVGGFLGCHRCKKILIRIFLHLWHDGDQTSDIAVNAILPKISDED